MLFNFDHDGAALTIDGESIQQIRQMSWRKIDVDDRSNDLNHSPFGQNLRIHSHVLLSSSEPRTGCPEPVDWLNP